MKIKLSRVNEAFHLRATNEDGVSCDFDASPDIGGHNLGMRPMQMVLAALGSCSTIDIILLMNKQRQPMRHIEIEVNGQRVQDQIPAVFTDIEVHYILYGDLDEAKVERACRLSMEKLCSVSKMLETSVNISWRYSILP